VPDVTIPLLLVCDTGREDEAITRLSRVGFDNCLGYLHGGFEAWQQAGNEVDRIESISAAEFADIIEQDPASHNLQILDVRKKSEFQSEHIPAAINAPLDYINDSMLLVNPTKTGYVHCAGGYRSMVFISILKARGYNNLIDIQGGFKAIKATEKVALTAYLAPTTML
jgi:rhodanese-related sulfurtransferase